MVPLVGSLMVIVAGVKCVRLLMIVLSRVRCLGVSMLVVLMPTWLSFGPLTRQALISSIGTGALVWMLMSVR